MITRRLVGALGFGQLVLWGVSYYLIGVFGPRIAADLGWSQTAVYGGFSAALVLMGIVSAPVGRLIDRFGGRPVLIAGSLLTAIGCAALALSHGIVAYYASWLCLGLAMRMSLYDAAFAALARIGGASARRGISGITLLGGLASTALWPIGEALAACYGWRGAVLCYAGLALVTVPLHALIPRERHVPNPGATATVAPRAKTRDERVLAGLLFGLVNLTANFLNSGMSAYMIGILAGLGLPMAAAVSIAALRGVGQSASRLGELAFGARLDPMMLGLAAAAVLPIAFAAGFAGGASVPAATAFAALYGAGNGLLTITRGTQPLVLFDPASYGTIVGRLIAPGFFVSALAPLVYAALIERFGYGSALILSLAAAAVTVAASLALWWRFPARPVRVAPAAP